MDHAPFYRDVPNSKITLLMIHGILGTPRHFDWLIPTIPERYQIYNVLLPGHGGTVSDFSNSSMEQWRTHVENTIQALEKHDKKIIVVAHSLGCLLALNSALRHPSIIGMILLNIPLCPQISFRLFSRCIRTAFGKLNLNDPEEVMYIQASGVIIEPYIWKYTRWIPNFISLLQLCRTSRKILSQLSMPIFAYLGGKDDLVSLKTSKWLNRQSNITLRIFPKGIHFGYSPQEQNQIMEDLSDLLASS